MPGLISKPQIINESSVQIDKHLVGVVVNEFGGLLSTYLAGEDLLEGEAVYITATDRTVKKNPVNSDAPIGVVYKDTKLGEWVKVVVAGLGYALPESGVTATCGYIVYSSNSEAGRFDQNSGIPGTTQHWREYGHVVQNGSGAGAKVLIEIHKN